MKKFIYEGKIYNKSILKCYWQDGNKLYFILENKEFSIPLTSSQLKRVYEEFDTRISEDIDFNLDEILNN